VCQALDPFVVEEADGEAKVLRYRKEPAGEITVRAAPGAGKEKIAARPELPPWLRLSVAAEAPRAAPLSPSSAFDEEIGRVALTAGSAADRQRALQRGRIVHRLMQSLPDIPPARRPDALERYLIGAAKDFSSAERSEIARQVFAILDAENFTQIFVIGSRAEVSIAGRIPRDDAEPLAVAGQVDRLSVTDDAVLIADYKTDSITPNRLADVPQPYIAQLALYRAVLARIYPEKTVRAALLFTSGPSLIEIPGTAMDAELCEVLKKDRHAAVKVP